MGNWGVHFVVRSLRERNDTVFRRVKEGSE